MPPGSTVRPGARGVEARLMQRVVVLGAGFGGLELTTVLAEEFAGEVEVVLIDRTEGFVFGFSKLDVMFGRTTAEQVFHPYADIVKPGVTFVRAEVTAIDPAIKRVETTAGRFQGDVLVIALGAEYDLARTPGLAEAGHEFYSEAGAFALQRTLAEFGGGDVVIGITAGPFKCPPAPSEAALLLDELLRARGIRDRSSISLVMPLPRPITPSATWRRSELRRPGCSPNVRRPQRLTGSQLTCVARRPTPSTTVMARVTS